MSEVILWLSPFAGALITWFIVNHVNEVKEKIQDVDTTVKVVSKNLHDTREAVIKIQADVEHLKKDVDDRGKIVKIWK